MELMTDEMADFKAAVLELREHSKELQDMSIPITTEALEKNLKIFLEKQEEKSRLKDDVLKSIDKKLKYAMLMPRYLLVIFGILGILMLGLLGYFGYTARSIKEENFEMYWMMIKLENDQYEEYFLEKPELEDDYCEWLEGKK